MEFKVIQGCSILTLHMFLSQSLDSWRKNTILLDQDVQVCGYIVANPNSTMLLEYLCIFFLNLNTNAET